MVYNSGLKSGSNQTWRQYPTNAVASNSINFNTPPPSNNTIVDRNIKFYLTMRIQLQGIPPVGEPIIQPGRSAPRAFPTLAMMTTLSSTINGNLFSIDIGELVHALMWYNNDIKMKNRDYSQTPCYQDQSQRYGDLFGSVRSPLSGYGDSTDENVCARGGFPFVIIANPIQTVAGTTLTATVDLADCTPLLLSPWLWGRMQESGWYNVTTMEFQMNFLTGLQAVSRCWSHDDNGGTNVITGGSVTFGGLPGGPTSFKINQPTLFFRYTTPLQSQF